MQFIQSCQSPARLPLEVQQAGAALAHASSDLKADKDGVPKLTSSDHFKGRLLRRLCLRLYSWALKRQDIVLAAVRQRGSSLEHACQDSFFLMRTPAASNSTAGILHGSA